MSTWQLTKVEFKLLRLVYIQDIGYLAKGFSMVANPIFILFIMPVFRREVFNGVKWHMQY